MTTTVSGAGLFPTGLCKGFIVWVNGLSSSNNVQEIRINGTNKRNLFNDIVYSTTVRVNCHFFCDPRDCSRPCSTKPTS